MNKLAGLFELKDLNIPSIDWNVYSFDTELDPLHLWTIRTAVKSGNDLNLPRLFGAQACQAKRFADDVLNRIQKNGIVIYYPYLIAEKSGVLQFNASRVVIETVSGDLIPLLSGKRVDATYIWNENEYKTIGSDQVLTKEEKEEILSYVEYLRKRFRDKLIDGTEIQLEFSYAYDSSQHGERQGEQKLVFFEIRTV